ncbi:MAG TPA: hypothetical protein VIJ99_06995 [Acidimicrobiales bacterium]
MLKSNRVEPLVVVSAPKGTESVHPPQRGDGPVDRVATQFAELVNAGALDLPLPGEGRTNERWMALAAVAAEDLCVARLAEAHVDAIAILNDLRGFEPPPKSRWGVWAAHPKTPALTAKCRDDEWSLVGTKSFCSGATSCTHALVTADADDGYRLFAVDLLNARPIPGSWPAVGMAGSESLTVDFDEVAAVAIGEPGAYLDRPGFWFGASAVAACWYGGAVGLARALLSAHEERELGPHALAHLGAVDAALHSLANTFSAHADEIDHDPFDVSGLAELRAMQLRATTEEVARNVLDRVGRALGARPLCGDGRHAALAADLPVYVRQSHAESDLERLGTLVLEKGRSW